MEYRDCFEWAWDLLSRQGKCDARGGSEYQRCREEWDSTEGPYAAMQYIKRAANAPRHDLPPIPEGQS